MGRLKSSKEKRIWVRSFHSPLLSLMTPGATMSPHAAGGISYWPRSCFLAGQGLCFMSIMSFPKHLHGPYREGCSALEPGRREDVLLLRWPTTLPMRCQRVLRGISAAQIPGGMFAQARYPLGCCRQPPAVGFGIAARPSCALTWFI